MDLVQRFLAETISRIVLIKLDARQGCFMLLGAWNGFVSLKRFNGFDFYESRLNFLRIESSRKKIKYSAKILLLMRNGVSQ